jgi:hypothetical protein
VGPCSAPMLMSDALPTKAEVPVNKLYLTRAAQCFVIRIL